MDMTTSSSEFKNNKGLTVEEMTEAKGRFDKEQKKYFKKMIESGIKIIPFRHAPDGFFVGVNFKTYEKTKHLLEGN